MSPRHALFLLGSFSVVQGISISGTPVQVKFTSGMCDASGVIPLRFGADPIFSVADDEINVVKTFRSGATAALSTFNVGGKLVGSQSSGNELDTEGAAIVNGKHFYITSHGRDKSGNLDSYGRYWFFSRNYTYGYHHLVDDMLNTTLNPALASLKSVLASATQFSSATVASLAPKDQGLCFEGFSEGSVATEAYIGLRNPLIGGKAILIPFTNPEAVLAANPSTSKTGLARFGEAISTPFDFGGRAFRAITKVPAGSTLSTGEAMPRFLIVAGAIDSTPPVWQLYSWSGIVTESATLIGALPDKIESIFWDNLGKVLWAISDEGSTLISGTECKSASSSKKFFYGYKVALVA